MVRGFGVWCLVCIVALLESTLGLAWLLPATSQMGVSLRWNLLRSSNSSFQQRASMPSQSRRRILPVTALASSAESNEAEKLKEQAERLRQEIEAFEQGKRQVERDERQKVEQERQEQVALRNRYSAIVPILKPDGTVLLEQCEFPPRYKDGTSFITICEASLPLGILLGEGQDDFAGLVVIDEIGIGSNGEKGGLQEGDIVRAFTACKMGMDMPTWQVIAGGIGVPKTRRFMYSVDRRPFEEVMDAVASNRMDPEMRPVLLVVERQEPPGTKE